MRMFGWVQKAFRRAGVFMAVGFVSTFLSAQEQTVDPTISDINKSTTATVRVEEIPGPMTLSTFHQQSTGMAIRAASLSNGLVKLPLHDPIWSVTFNGSPLDTVSDTLVLKSITIPDLGESLADHVSSLSILDSTGKVLATTTGTPSRETADAKLLELKSYHATHVKAYPTTYTFGTPVELPCHSTDEEGKTTHEMYYYLQFNTVDANKNPVPVSVNIPVFQNDATTREDADATQLIVEEEDVAPYMLLTTETSFDKVTVELTNPGTFSLATMIAKAQALHLEAHPTDTNHAIDNFHHLIVLRAQTPNVIVEMDTNLLEAEVVMASNTAASTYNADGDVTTRAATLRFMEGVKFTGALSVRDISKNTDDTNGPGFVRFEYVDTDATNGTTQELVIPTSVLSPFSFTQSCDVELASYPQMTRGAEITTKSGTTTTTTAIDSATANAAEDAHWFWRNSFTVPSGRSLRLVTCTNENTHLLPKVAFTDATSILDLDFDSSSHTEHEMAEAVGQVIDSSSGTLKIHSATTSNADLDAITMGTEVGAIYGIPTEQTIHTHNNLTVNSSFVIANGQGTMADIIQHDGTTTIGDANDYFRFGRGSTTDGTALGAARAIYELNAGTLNVPGTLLFSNRVQVGRLSIGDGKVETDEDGEPVLDTDGTTVKGTAVATIGTLLSQPAYIESGTPNLGQSLAADVTGIATVEVLSDGHLKLGNNLNFTPPDKSFFYLEGGTLEATTRDDTRDTTWTVTNADGTTTSNDPTYEGTRFSFGQDTSTGGGLRLRGGNTVTSTIKALEGSSARTHKETVTIQTIGENGQVIATSTQTVDVYNPSLTVDAVTGDGNLLLDGAICIKELRDFRGLVSANVPETDGDVTQWGRIEKISGARSVIIFGDLGDQGTLGVMNVLMMAKDCDYRGSLGFDPNVTIYKSLDVQMVPIEAFGHAIRVDNGQELIIRLDQFIDSTIVWPEVIDEDNPPLLTLVEAGAYGGRVQLSHIPDEVRKEMVFEYYDDNGNRQSHTDGTWTLVTEESGVTDILSWEEPHVTGISAWIDVEFDGNSLNTGWMSLANADGSKNGALKGLSETNDYYGRLLDITGSNGGNTTDTRFFTETYNPSGQGVRLYARPYIETSKLTYPATWSVAARMQAPTVTGKVIFAMGTLFNTEDGTDCLVLSVEAVKEATDATPSTARDFVLWHIEKIGDIVPSDGKYVKCTKTEVARKTVANPSGFAHIVSAICNGESLDVFVDGKFVTSYALPDGLSLGKGLQLGQLLDPRWYKKVETAESTDYSTLSDELQGVNQYATDGETEEGGVVDYIRFYKGVLTDESMEALAEESPAIDRATRYYRTLSKDGELWVDTTTNPWTRQTWNGSSWDTESTKYSEPTEGAEVRIYCPGNYTLYVNTEKDEDDGFLTPNRSYSLLTVTASEDGSATSDVHLTLAPIGGAPITKKATEESDWVNEKLEGTDEYRYGTVHFQGGAGDLVHPEAAMEPYATRQHTLWLRNYDVGGGTVTEGSYGATKYTLDDNVETSGRQTIKYTRSRTLTQTRTDTKTLSSTGTAHSVTLSVSAGICKLQEQTPIVVDAQASTQKRTLTKTAIQTATIRKSKWAAAPTDTEWNNATWSPAEANVTWTETQGAWLTTSDSTDDLVKNTLVMRADYSLIRGATHKESAIHVLTGPVEGAGNVVGNTDINEDSTQESQDVWVPKFADGDEWFITDVTRTYYGSGNERGTLNGLIAKVMQVPGRLYLDLSQQDIIADGLFSKQNWYRYGYIGTLAAATESGVDATPIYGVTENEDGTITVNYTEKGLSDFGLAIAFQIKTSAEETKTLVLDTTKTDVGTLRVDLPDGYTTGDAVPTLALKTTSYTETDTETSTTTTKWHNLNITGLLITFARLQDTEAYIEGEDEVNHPALTIQEGAHVHGHTTGTYAFRDHQVDWLVKDSTVANLEVHGTGNVFSNSVELHDTNLILADDAMLHQSNPDAHLWMKSLTLGDGATFNFEARGADAEENGVVFLERVTLTGTSATLFGGGELGSDETVANVDLASHFTAAGFTAEQANTILTMESEPLHKGNATTTVPNRWICYTADFQTATENKVDADGNPVLDADGKPVQVPLGGFGLTKTGSGTMAFRDIDPPSLSGPVRVEKGILRVGGKSQASDALLHDSHLTDAIGHHGLYVAKGATLAANRLTPTDYIIACLERGQTLSGTGTIDGNVRLCSGAIIDKSGQAVADSTDEDGKTVAWMPNFGMTVRRFVVDGSDSSDVIVNLPEGIAVSDDLLAQAPTVDNRPTLFYLLEDSVRAETRRRFSALKPVTVNGEEETERWDVVGEHADTTSTPTQLARYYLEPAYFPVPTAPTSETGNAYADAVRNTLITYYQMYGVANIVTAEGHAGVHVTDDGTTEPYSLNASEIGDAFTLFSNIWTFAADPKDTTSVDSSHFLMAYDFGIARQNIRALETGTKDADGNPVKGLYVVLEVAVENQLLTHFGEDYGTTTTTTTNNDDGTTTETTTVTLVGAHTKADFQLNTKLEIWKQVNLGDLVQVPDTEIKEILSFDAPDLTAPTVATRTAGRRYYAIPYTDANFPQRSTTTLTVKASR